jgi:hypothetical protein
VSAALCGNSPWGIGAVGSAKLITMAEAVQYGGANDGALPFESCAGVGPAIDKWGKGPTSRFYSADANHYDGTCRNGDGWGAGSKPCAWLKNALADEFDS